MVYPKGVKEVAHMVNALLEPLSILICKYIIPIVCRKSPILSIAREIVRRRTCLLIKVEILRVYPNIGTVSVEPDGEVALENDASATGILVYMRKLLVKQILDDALAKHLAVKAKMVDKWADNGCFIAPHLRPTSEVRSTEVVCQHSISAIWLQPEGIVLGKLLIVFSLGNLLPFILERLMNIVQF